MSGIFSNDEQEIREEGGTNAIMPDDGGTSGDAVGTSDRDADMAASGSEGGASAGGAAVTDSSGEAVGADDHAADVEGSGGSY